MDFITLNTIVTDLLNIVRASNIAQSEPISKRQLEDWVHQYRSLLLKQDLDKGKFPNPDYIQEISHLRLEAIDLSGDEVTSTGKETGFYVSRSELQLPKTLDLNFKSGFMYVGTIAGDELQFIPEGRSKWQKYKKYTDGETMAYLKNRYLYVQGPEPVKYITVRGVFEIPPEVGRFVNPITNQPYYNIESKYPIPANMLPVLKEMILSKELRIEAVAPTDTKTDKSHNPKADR